MGFVYSMIAHSLFLDFLWWWFEAPTLFDCFFHFLGYYCLPFGVLPCRLRLQSWRDGVVDWKGREGGWGSGGKGLLVVASILRKSMK